MHKTVFKLDRDFLAHPAKWSIFGSVRRARRRQMRNCCSQYNQFSAASQLIRLKVGLSGFGEDFKEGFSVSPSLFDARGRWVKPARVAG